MQAQCPQCSTRFQLDDSKVPDRAFKVRCPRCQHVVVLQGPGGEASAPPSPESSGAQETAETGSPAAAPPAPVRREHEGSKDARDALVALPDAALAAAITSSLGNLDYNVDVVEDVEEGARLLEQGVYEVAVTARSTAEPGRAETLGQRILRLPPDPRRRVFVVLVGAEFTTGDGTQAWATQADLVLSPHDAAGCENVIRSTLAERQRLYQPFSDARRKIESD